MNFKQTLIAIAAIAAGASAFAGPISISINTGGNGVTVVGTNGTSSSVSLGATGGGQTITTTAGPSTPASGSYASFTPVAFDAGTWAVSGGAFTASTYVPAVAGAAAQSYVVPAYTTTADVATFITGAQTLMSGAINDEINTINTMVGTTSGLIASYNTGNNTDTSETAGNAKVVSDSITALKDEVAGSKAAFDTVKGIQFHGLVDSVSVIGDLASTGTVQTGWSSAVATATPTYSVSYDGARIITTGNTTTTSVSGGVTNGVTTAGSIVWGK